MPTPLESTLLTPRFQEALAFAAHAHARDVRKGTDLLVKDAVLGRALAATLAKKPAALMRGHGSVVVGENLPRAVGRSVYLEQSARMQMQAMALAGAGGNITYFDDAEVQASIARQDYYRATTGIHSERLVPTSRLLSSITGLQVQRNKAIVGRNAFAHDFKRLADKKKDIYDGDIIALIEQRIHGGEQTEWSLVAFEVASGSGRKPHAKLTLRRGGQEHTAEVADGDGPIDAAFLATEKLTGIKLKCVDYQVRSATLGHDALGEVNLSVEHGGQTFRGRGVSTDTVEATVQAILNATNRIAVTAK